MKPFLNSILAILKVVLIGIVVLFSPLLVYSQYFGIPNAEKFLERLSFPLTFSQTATVAIVSMTILGVGWIIRKKVAKK